MYIVRNIKNNVYLQKTNRGIYNFGYDKKNALKFENKSKINKKFKNEKFEIVKV